MPSQPGAGAATPSASPSQPAGTGSPTPPASSPQPNSPNPGRGG
ncbi:hypothetical protein FHS46_003199 [Variibacter gotjawalensis]|nr:hypothetical protein [Variibacter gotjawalensis]